MTLAPDVDASTRRFACTQCGKCCDRSPEIELSEASKLADVFVFRLMFRLYSQSRSLERGNRYSPQEFFEQKRLLNAHAARVYPAENSLSRKIPGRVNYLMISALALDTSPGTCTALHSSRCSVYERRPLACRTVPFHYARGEAAAARDLDAFVKTPGYRCDVSDDAPVVLSSDVIVDPSTRAARSQALAVAKQDIAWKKAIVRAMKHSSDLALPTLSEVETNAPFAAATTSMRVAWQIAAGAGLISNEELRTLVGVQLATIEQELEKGRANIENRQTLLEMKAEYGMALGD